MLVAVPESAKTIIAVAAFTGARAGEIEGMVWENYRKGGLFVSRSIWHGHVTEPKTKASKAAILVVPYLAVMLERHRVRMGNPNAGPFSSIERQADWIAASPKAPEGEVTQA